MSKKRFILSIGFTEEQEVWLKRVAVSQGLSVSTYIRKLVVDAMLFGDEAQKIVSRVKEWLHESTNRKSTSRKPRVRK
jgi:hypothetical protein